MMKPVFTLLLILSVLASAMAQDSINNRGFDHWHGGFFSPGAGTSHGVQCCGIALAVPIGWGIPEQLMAMPTNQFVYKETDTANIFSGSFSAKLYTNITSMDSAGDVPGGLAVLVPGRVTCAGIVAYGGIGLTGDLYQNIAYSGGGPFTDTPLAMSFYMKMRHDVADTAHYAYVFTRWDSTALREDTLAYREVDIADAALPYNQWTRFLDTIHYTGTGLPDTLHLIFYGGRNGDSTRVGNITWLDDISFYRSGQSTVNTGIIHLSLDDAVSVYPNPATTTLHVRLADDMTGYTLELYDLTAQRLMHQPLTAGLSSYATATLPDGVYLYRILDPNAAQLTTGKLTILK